MHVLERGGGDVLHGADDRVMVRMGRREEERLHPLVPVPIGLVVVPLPPLVHDHVALVLQLLFGHRRQHPAHPVRFQPQGQVEVVGRDGIVVVRAVEPRRGVGRAAHLLDLMEVPVLRDVRRTLEHHVLEEVREPRARPRLVPGAHAIPEVDRHDRRRPVGCQYEPEAVGERVLLDLDHVSPGHVARFPGPRLAPSFSLRATTL